MLMNLCATQVHFAYDRLEVLRGVDLAITPGITAIVGPNAAGKSTLLRCLCGLLRPKGKVQLDQRDIRHIPRNELAETVSYLPQHPGIPAALTVFETVLLGRVQRLAWHVAAPDLAAVESLLGEFGISSLGNRRVNELSGGQAQLVFLAQALACNPAVLLLDEPNAGLDFHHQFEMCACIRERTRARGLSTAMIMHDLNLAARVADVVQVLVDGRIRCGGPPECVLTEELLAEVYGIEAHVAQGHDGHLLVTPVGLRRHTLASGNPVGVR